MFTLTNKESDFRMTLKNKRQNRPYRTISKRAQIFIGLANVDANNVISPWNFLESYRHFALTPFEMQYCDWVIDLFTALVRSFLGGNKEKLCFNPETNCERFFKVIRKSL